MAFGSSEHEGGEAVVPIVATSGDGDRYNVRSVHRALRLIEVVASGPAEGSTLTALATAVGASKSTVLATVRTLAGEGFLRATEPGPLYKLGTALIRFGDLATQQSPVTDVCREVLREASAATGMTARLAIAEQGYPVCVERVDGPGMVRFQAPLGRREPPHATAAGKSVLAMLSRARVLEICGETGLPLHTARTITEVEALLADLERVRQRGYAIDDEEEFEGVFCVGAPFFGYDGACAGAISVTGIKQDLPQWKVAELGMELRRLADEASRLCGGPTFDEVGRRLALDGAWTATGLSER